MKEGNQEMNFFDHLEELRHRIIKSVIAILIMAVVIFIYQEWVMDNIFLIKAKVLYLRHHLELTG